jgi:hypothetical protein
MIRVWRAVEAFFVAMLLLALLMAGLLSAPAVAQMQWPGEVLLWHGAAPVTQTAQYAGASVIGADNLHVYYDTGLASATGTLAITVTRQWRGVVFDTLTATGTASTTAKATGVITVATSAPYYPDVLVALSVSAGTITPTIAVVGQ